MYFYGKLSVDPSSLTHVGIVEPTKAFAKILRFMTAGLASAKEERETFTAVSILQQFNRVFMSLGISNIVRIAKDGEDFYLDTEGRENDLKEAMEAFAKKASGSSSQKPFESLRLVLEHEGEDLKYLIELEINRVHKVGEYPIIATINGLMKNLRVDAKSATASDVNDLLKPTFSSQQTYDEYTQTKQVRFDSMLDAIESAVRQQIGVDDIKRTTERRIIRPSKRVNRRDDWQARDGCDPVYSGYHECDDYFFYTWMWAAMCHEEDIHCSDCAVVDEQGLLVFEVGEDGFDAGMSNALNPDEPFEVPADTEVTAHTGSVFADAFESADSTKFDNVETSGGWLSSFSSDDSGASVSDSGGGGGCGGGCGGG